MSPASAASTRTETSRPLTSLYRATALPTASPAMSPSCERASTVTSFSISTSRPCVGQRRRQPWDGLDLEDEPLEQLDVAPAVSREPLKLCAGGGEEVLQVGLARLEELEPAAVRLRRLRAVRGVRLAHPNVRYATDIFCATSAPLRFFSNAASMPVHSCLTILA